MQPMTIEGVRRNFLMSSVFLYTATLIDETGQYILNVGVERDEAMAVVAALHNLTLPRPQAIHLMAETLAFHGLTLKEVHLEHFIQSPIFLFSATLVWRDSNHNAHTQHYDIRPGDALALALLMRCPLLLPDEVSRYCVHLAEGQTPELYAIHELLKRERIILPADKKLRLGHSKTPMRDFLVKEFKASLMGKAPVFPEEDMEQRKKDYLTFLSGNDYEQYKQS